MEGSSEGKDMTMELNVEDEKAPIEEDIREED